MLVIARQDSPPSPGADNLLCYQKPAGAQDVIARFTQHKIGRFGRHLAARHGAAMFSVGGDYAAGEKHETSKSALPLRTLRTINCWARTTMNVAP